MQAVELSSAPRSVWTIVPCIRPARGGDRGLQRAADQPASRRSPMDQPIRCREARSITLANYATLIGRDVSEVAAPGKIRLVGSNS